MPGGVLQVQIFSGYLVDRQDMPHSRVLTIGFAACAIALALGLTGLTYLAGTPLGESPRRTRRWALLTAGGAAGWMAATWLLANAGIFSDFSRRPPPFMLLLVAVFALSAVLAFGPFGTRLVRGLPLWVLVFSQAFRLPLEWLMHRAAAERVMPVQMSYSGRNFDVVTGATAILVGWLVMRGRAGRSLVVAWNLVGCVLLANILTIAVLSTPVFAAFGRDHLNTFVADPPFVWLPAVMVLCAITGHLLVWRKLGDHRVTGPGRHPD
jgi:hypothetical protein